MKRPILSLACTHVVASYLFYPLLLLLLLFLDPDEGYGILKNDDTRNRFLGMWVAAPISLPAVLTKWSQPGLIALYLLLLAMAWIVLTRRKFRTATGATACLCPACGYSLRGNVSGTCPECGRTTPARGAS